LPNVSEVLPKIQGFGKSIKLVFKIMKNKNLPLECPLCGKLLEYNAKHHRLECYNPRCNLIMIRVFKDGKVRVFQQPKLSGERVCCMRS
jgi:endogenous inhibitor of DNA gyrase (YacG/DUF329 family)